MKKETLIKYCLFCEDAIVTYPFKEYPKTPVLRHKSSGKWFGLIFYLDSILYINLKIRPEEGAILRDMYDFVTPAWHMNKTHWIKVEAGKAPKDLLKRLIKLSFDIT